MMPPTRQNSISRRKRARPLNPTKRIKHLLKLNVMFHTTDPTPSPSPLEMLCRCIVDHHTSPVICSLFPSGQFLYRPRSSGTLLYVKTPSTYLWHFTCQWTPLNLLSISDYGHAWSRYHMFSFPCHTLVLLFHMLLLIIPHAISKSSTCSLPFVTYHVSSLQYISFKYPSCIFFSFIY